MKNVKALILCGGKGTRLRPLTLKIPKPLICINNKSLIEHQISFLKKYGVKKIILSTGYLSEKIERSLKDGTKLGVEISYVKEETPLGTGGGIKNAEKFLKETFIVLNGDNLFDLNLKKMYEQHKNSNSLATIALKELDDVKSFGVVKLKGKKIVEFLEKPKNPDSKLINAGLYVLEPEFLKKLPVGVSSIEKDGFEKLSKGGFIEGFIFTGKWYPTDTLERYERAKSNWN